MHRLPLHDLHVAAGARIAAPCDWELPIDYGDAAAEYAAVRNAAGILDRGGRGVLEVTGRDRAKFLHAMLSNDIASLTPGQGREAAFLDIHGKVQVVLTVWAVDERLLVLTPPGLAEKTLAEFDKFLFSEKAYFRDATGEMAMLVLAGPDAPSIVERLLGALPPDAPWSHLVAKLGEIEIRAVRGGGETGAPEIWLVSAAAEGPAVWNALRDAGARPVGLTAEDALRVEAGTALYGHDVDETVLLPEIPLAHLVSYTKGCYIGQEVVVRIRDRGHVNRLLTGLRVEGREIPPHGARVRVDGQDVGQVTSAVWSFGLDAVVALGFVRRQHAAPGTAVTVAVDDQDVPAVVSALPFSR